MILLLDVATPGLGTVGIAAGVVVLLLFAAAAFLAFKLLKRSLKMAMRLAVVGIILAIGIAGCVFFFAISAPKYNGPARRPPPTNR